MRLKYGPKTPISLKFLMQLGTLVKLAAQRRSTDGTASRRVILSISIFSTHPHPHHQLSMVFPFVDVNNHTKWYSGEGLMSAPRLLVTSKIQLSKKSLIGVVQQVKNYH